MRIKAIILTAILANCTILLFGQQYYFRHYQVENGLSYTTISCTIQDSKGFMWFGTKDGLNRFDGNTFKVFRHDKQDSTSIGSNVIYTLAEGNDQNLWVGTKAGIFIYDEITESFHPFFRQLNEVRDIQHSPDGTVWFISYLKLYRYNSKTDSVPINVTQGNEEFTCITRSSDGGIWLSNSHGWLRTIDPQTNQFSGIDIFSHSPPPATTWIEKVVSTGKGSIIICTPAQGAKLYDIATNTYKDILTYNPDNTTIYVRDCIKTGDDEYWIATESGIFIYTLSTGKYINLRKEFNNPYSINDNAIYCLVKDKEGGIWAGTFFGGVNYYPKQYTTFRKYFPDNTTNTVSGNAVREICEDKYGNFWIGTEDAGLNKLDPKTGEFTHFMPSGSPNTIAYSNIHGLLAVDNELWIGTFEHGIDVMDIRTSKVIRHYVIGQDSNSLKSNFALTLKLTSSGEIIIGTTVGLYTYNRKKDNFHQVKEVPLSIFIYDIHEDHEGTMWIATIGNGVYYYNKRTGESGNIGYDENSPGGLLSDHVNELHEDSDHNIWFATDGGGLCKYDKKNKSIKVITSRQGLPSNFVFKILEDGNRNLWVTTAKGLVSFNLDTEAMRVFTKAHGLLNDQFNYSSGYKDSEGRMYFGSVKGMISFDPDNFVPNTFNAPVYITGFQVNNRELGINEKNSPLQKSIIHTDQISLPYDQSSFSIDFSALTYTAPEVTSYAYKMQGINNDWTYLSTNRKVYFTQLSPGKYTFQVKAANSDGVWSSHQATLVIRINPPWWYSTWAWVTYITIAILLILYIIRSYHRRTEAKNRRRFELLEHEKEKEIYHAKIEFFTNVAHEIRTPLTLIRGPLEKIVKRAADIPDMQKHLLLMEKNTNRLINLTSQLLDFRKTESKGFSLNFVKVDISAAVEDQFNNFSTLAEKKELQFNLTLPPKKVYAYVDMEAFEKIISNLFSNVVKYAQTKAHIQLDAVNEDADVFTIIFRNDGYIIPMEMSEKIFEPFFRSKEAEMQTGSGIGLALSRSLAELHNGMLELKPTEQDMNVFVLRLPVHQEIEFNLH